jgi:hypothetical protein
MTPTLTIGTCVACGEPATRVDNEGVPLCEGDYQHLAERWRLDGFGVVVAPTPTPAATEGSPAGFVDGPATCGGPEPSTGRTEASGTVTT